jgi:hypothetical protein
MREEVREDNSKFRIQNSKFRIIRASEIGEYSYCARAWWYRHVVKLSPPDGKGAGRLVEGTRLHARHGREVASSAMLRVAALTLLAVGLLAIALSLLLMRA